MTVERLAVLRGRYRKYLEAERAILTGQSYSMEGLSLTRANLADVQKAIAQLETQILIEERKASGTRRSRLRVIVPVDGLRMGRRRMFT